MKDTYYHKGMRRRLVDELKQKGISDEKVLQAIDALPRHFFLDKAFEEQAYEDKAFPIGQEQTISQPYTVAFQTQLLGVETGDRILEIGTGSGYQAAILGLLGAEVFTIERQEALYQKTKLFLKQIGIHRVKCFFGDGNDGLPSFAPFHKILVTAGSTEIPDKLLQQLHIGGTMVIPVGSSEQKMKQIIKMDATKIKIETYGTFKFVPFQKGINKM